MRSVVLSLVLLLVAVGACGGNGVDLSEEEQAVADAIVDFIVGGDEFASQPLTEADVRCIGEETVDRIGLDGLEELGVTASSIPEENPFEGAPDEYVDHFVDAYFDCSDVASMFAEAMTTVGSVSEESSACVAAGLDGSGILRPLLRASLAGGDPSDDPALFGSMMEIFIDCLSADELADIGGG